MSGSEYLTDDTIFIYNDILHEDDARDDSNSRIDSSRTGIEKFPFFSHRSTAGYSRSYRRGSWVVKTSNRSTGIKSDWHDVVTSSLSSDHTITICSQRSSGSLLYQIERESNKGGSDEALGKPELTHGWLAPSSTPNKWNLFLILFFIWSNRRVFDYFYI